MRKAYANKPPNRNLHRYFCETKLPNIQIPHRRFFTTNDPVMTPDLIDYFFNERNDRLRRPQRPQEALLHLIYDLPEYKKVLRPGPATAFGAADTPAPPLFGQMPGPPGQQQPAGSGTDSGEGRRGIALRFPRPRRPADTSRRVAQCDRPTGPQRGVGPTSPCRRSRKPT